MLTQQALDNPCSKKTVDNQAEKGHFMLCYSNKKTSHILYEMPFCFFYVIFFVVSRFFQS
ncbi:hypothetical protein [Clostridioides difficile]|uniref:hypothetical protein n=1 Tax=Clostridioides difficile TaxID=1496 RepID=UPI0013566964|nr:hypothetical protein [Clostridioides difficile]